MSTNAFRYRRVIGLAAVLSLTVLVPGIFRMASAQPPAAPAPAPATAPPASADETPKRAGGRMTRANPVNEALKGLDLTKEQKDKIKEIRAQARKDFDAVPDRRSAAGQAKVREINAKIAADIKASLPADLQTKFQTAYDAAEAKNAAQTQTAGLRTFRQPLESLNLTPEQQAKVDPIVKESYDKIVALRQDQSVRGADRTSRTETIITDMKAKIRPLLTAPQQTQLDALDLKPKAGQGRRRAGAGGRNRNGNAAPTAPAAAPAAPAP